MPHRIPRLMFTQPLAHWTELATTTTEMFTAAAEVIGHRTLRMALAGPLPDTEDQQEFTLMGQEKLDAAMESATAMATHVVDAQHRLFASTLRHMLHGSTAMLSLASSLSPEQAAERQARLGRAIARSAIAATRLSHAPAALARHGLEPIHARATANARRLGGK